MRKLKLVESAIQYTTTRNRYGDLQVAAVGTIPCLFRNISQVNRGSNREEDSITGIFWFKPTATVAKGDAIQYQGQFYRIVQIIVAKTRLTDNRTQFLKCQVSQLRQLS